MAVGGYGMGNANIWVSGTTATTNTLFYDPQVQTYQFTGGGSPIDKSKPSPKDFYKRLTMETKDWLRT